ncbi:MAG: ADP-ribosylglycohydrolase family protein [Lewinellaceae bacterium]|nr:ADP-ribosylglycohydrolase family protein [Lewinellaceae bacterium]
MIVEQQIKSALFGLAVGDALGVPVEFVGRPWLKKHPLEDMRGHGTHDQPPGTWSDDSSLSFCLAESLCSGYNLRDIADKFLAWYRQGEWAARGEVFDIGNSTIAAMERLSNRALPPELAGGLDERSNGNGSLMRIMPLLFYIHNKPIDERYQACSEVSSLTHGHFRSVFSCFLYLEAARLLLQGETPAAAFHNSVALVRDYAEAQQFNRRELSYFTRIFNEKLPEVQEDNIYSTGYVLHTLEAAFWCLLTTDNYRDAVLRAANLGEDTDTTAAVAGGLAGLAYGFDAIPPQWVEQLARRQEIEALCQRLAKALTSSL